MKPLVLLSNDDGHDAPGLLALRDALAGDFDVVVCAPLVNQSAVSHALTLHRILRLRHISEGCFAIDGTPADCVYTALHAAGRILPRAPDLVVSGMNHGANLGRDVIYSGTVAAAREAAQRGIPAMAVSAHPRASLPRAAALAASVAQRLQATWAARSASDDVEAGPAPLLNLNIPAGDNWDVRITRIGRRNYTDEVIFRDDPRGKPYLWIGGSDVQHEQDPATDTGAWDAGVASLTPIRITMDERPAPNWLHELAHS
jgi:5'-nucleotidase